MGDQEPGRWAYEAYCQTRGWRSVRGEPLPQWSEQAEEIRAAWRAAAEAVRIGGVDDGDGVRF